ncbi:MAG: hypothetical protein L0226_15060 [Acidobacteria bacterium]|nr:hypothetical protein [Acidobacteriota bacterium]
MRKERAVTQRALAKVRKQRKELDDWQKKTGITLIEMKPTDQPDLWRYNVAPIARIMQEVFAMIKAGVSEDDAVKVVTDRIKQEAARKKASFDEITNRVGEGAMKE